MLTEVKEFGGAEKRCISNPKDLHCVTYSLPSVLGIPYSAINWERMKSYISLFSISLLEKCCFQDNIVMECVYF